ncbi:ADP-heptose:LPS heptosyltransferase [Oxalobacteraceae bacterium GrIS 1.11]
MSIEAVAGAGANTGGPVAPLKVLFFSHDGKLGDAVVSTAFVAGLRAHAPHCEIHATVAGATAVFWARDARLRTLWPLARRGWRAVFATGRALRRERFDYIVTWRPMRSEKNRFLLWLARPGRVIDLRQFHASPPRHQIDACREALLQIGWDGDGELAYALGAGDGAQLGGVAADGREIIVVNLFAADRERNIDAQAGAAILRGLRSSAPEALLCLVCSDATAGAARHVLAQPGVVAQLLNCEGNLERLIALCGRADLLISTDTALIHLASAFDTPVIGIYQNDGVKALQWAPRSRLRAQVLAAGADSIAGFSVEGVLQHAAALRAQARPA